MLNRLWRIRVEDKRYAVEIGNSSESLWMVRYFKKKSKIEAEYLALSAILHLLYSRVQRMRLRSPMDFAVSQ
jgi:hypothetical protein